MNNRNITLRHATLDDLELLTYWDSKPHVIAAGISDWDWHDNLLKNVAWMEHFIAELNGRPIGFLQLLDPARDESGYWGEVEPGIRALDIWIGEASDLSKGYGSNMMKLALQRCFADPAVNKVLIDPLKSNERAHVFYQRLGFKFLEERQLEGQQCWIFQLSRDDWLAAHKTAKK